jgi:hypothetical protein
VGYSPEAGVTGASVGCSVGAGVTNVGSDVVSKAEVGCAVVGIAVVGFDVQYIWGQ